eukprot:365420-Chlamydomonas_euryale.AAC.3
MRACSRLPSLPSPLPPPSALFVAGTAGACDRRASTGTYALTLPPSPDASRDGRSILRCETAPAQVVAGRLRLLRARLHLACHSLKWPARTTRKAPIQYAFTAASAAVHRSQDSNRGCCRVVLSLPPAVPSGCDEKRDYGSNSGTPTHPVSG